jgi:hypothetical protein
MARSVLPRRLQRPRTVAVVLAVALLAGLTAACSPTTTKPTTLPVDLEQMTDAQVSAQLAKLAPSVLATASDPKFMATVPADQRAGVQQIIDEIATADGRTKLVSALRTAAYGVPRGLPQRASTISATNIGQWAGANQVLVNPTTLTGNRVSPTDPSTKTGASVNVGQPTAGACHAPGGIGTRTVPTGVVAGQLITPQHDVYTTPSAGIQVGTPGPLVATGVDPVAGGGSGIELRNLSPLGGAEQMHVVVDLEDAKFGPAALYPLIDIKPIGGSAASEYRATVSDGHIYCYQGDTNTKRGYFDGWITVPQSEPGFGVTAEVVDNDWYFQNVHFDLGLAPAGPQYWAGADRSTVHVGKPAVTSPAPLARSVGAFATGATDGSAASVPNVLTDTNGNQADDLEGTLKSLITNTIEDKVYGALAGDLAQVYVFTAQASLTQPLSTSVDLKFTTPQDGFSGLDEPAGATGAIAANISLEADMDLFIQVLGVPCFGMTATAKATVTGNVWADSTGTGTGIEPHLQYDRDSNVDFDMPLEDWADPTCVLAYLIGPPYAEHKINTSIDDGIYGTFLPVRDPACFDNRSVFNANGSMVHADQPLPADCANPTPGTFQKLLEGFNLDDYLPSVTLGTATIQPFVTKLSNSWCTSTGAPPGCNSDQDLIGTNGPGVVADATMVSSLGQAVTGQLGGRFPNVFAPTTISSVDQLTNSHRDISGNLAGIGVVVDPRLVDLALRDLVQGSSTTRTTNGLLDISNYDLGGGLAVTTRPEVAPEILGGVTASQQCPPNCTEAVLPAASAPPPSHLATVVVPDLRISLKNGPGAPTQFSVSGSLQAGAQFDPLTGKLKPLLKNPDLDIQVVGGCQADYTNAYYLSYAMCGRGVAGNGSPTTLSSLVDYLVNQVVTPVVTDSIGEVSLPSLSSVLPSIGLDFTNIRFAMVDGFVTAQADMKPAPSIGIAVSTTGSGQPTDSLRFFPDVWNISPPFTVHWGVKDATTGQAVATIPEPLDPADAVEAPISEFADHDTNFGTGRTATATLTIDQPTVHITTTADYTWYPPSLPPKTGCLGTGGVGHFATPAVGVNPIGPGGPGTNPSGCIPTGPTNP